MQYLVWVIFAVCFRGCANQRPADHWDLFSNHYTIKT